MMKSKLFKIFVVVTIVFSLCAASITVFAQEKPTNYRVDNVEFSSEGSAGVRSKEEIQDLLNAYRKLFPKQYHYIQEYLNKGIDYSIAFPKIVFEGTRTLNNTNYTITIYDNRQLTTVIAYAPVVTENVCGLVMSDNTKGGGITQKESYINLGDLNYYDTFHTTYFVDWADYDYIYNVSVSGGHWYPSTVPYNQFESSSGCAYYIYKNAYCSNIGTTPLYNMGVSVGNNQITGRCQLATDWSSFFWYMLYGLLS